MKPKMVDYLLSVEDNKNEDLKQFLNSNKTMINLPRAGEFVCEHCKCVENEVDVGRVQVQQIFPPSSSHQHVVPVSALTISCHMCEFIIAINVDSQWYSLHEILRTDSNSRHGFVEVKTFGERVILFVLNQIIYLQSEGIKNAPFPRDECAKILWCNKTAIGFYTWKGKGAAYSSCLPYRYALPVVDVIFIHPNYRRRGFATKLLEDIVEMVDGELPGQDIGFSEPISPAMLMVMNKFLMEERNAQYKYRLWEVSYTGREDERQLVWYMLKTCSHTVDDDDGAKRKLKRDARENLNQKHALGGKRLKMM